MQAFIHLKYNPFLKTKAIELTKREVVVSQPCKTKDQCVYNVKSYFGSKAVHSKKTECGLQWNLTLLVTLIGQKTYFSS